MTNNPGEISPKEDSPEKLSSAKMAKKTPNSVSNPYKLTYSDEVLEIADYNIRLCDGLEKGSGEGKWGSEFKDFQRGGLGF